MLAQAQHLIATRRASGSTALLLASTAPFEVDGMRLTAVLLVDVTADPSSPHAISEAAAAVSHPYCMRGALLHAPPRLFTLPNDSDRALSLSRCAAQRPLLATGLRLLPSPLLISPID